MFAPTLKLEAIISNHVTVDKVNHSRGSVGFDYSNAEIISGVDAFYFAIKSNGDVSRWDFAGEAFWGNLSDGSFAATAKAAFAEGVEWVTRNEDNSATMVF